MGKNDTGGIPQGYSMIAAAEPLLFSSPHSQDPRSFYQRSRNARKILVMDMGRLGDAIHLLPALNLVRQNYPRAELHVLIGNQKFFEKLVPWVDVAWPAMHQVFANNLSLIKKLRKEKFDAAIVLNCDDCAVCVGRAVGASQLLGRRYLPTRPWWWQPLLFSHVTDVCWNSNPVFVQKWQALQQAGLKGSRPNFALSFDQSWLEECGIAAADRKSYLHYAPFTSVAYKDLPEDQHVEILCGLAKIHSRIVVSCDDSPRQKAALERILGKLTFSPWRVFEGSLEIHQFMALVDGARLHVGGDSGGLHVARLFDTPSITWFRDVAAEHSAWAPLAAEAVHRSMHAQSADSNGIGGVSTRQLLASIRKMLSSDALAPAVALNDDFVFEPVSGISTAADRRIDSRAGAEALGGDNIDDQDDQLLYA